VCSPSLATVSRQTEDETLYDRRCDQSDSEGNGAIFDCTGEKNVNQFIGYIEKREVICFSFFIY
jgi:hypothetical protein